MSTKTKSQKRRPFSVKEAEKLAARQRLNGNAQHPEGTERRVEGRKRKPTAERFWASVEPQNESGCIEWSKQRDRDGYGYFKFNGGPVRAHRMSWILTFGEIPDGLWVLHKCDNPTCVNPDHLFLGTAKDNEIDKIAKGRQNYARGEDAGPAKLTSEQVIQIRPLIGTRTQISIANEFGVSSTLVRKIKNRKVWKHI